MTTIEEFDILNCQLDGRNLIEASAGTGKTYAISRIVIRLLLEKRLAIGTVLAVTFTEAATEELKRRIREILYDAKTAFETGRSTDPLLQALLTRCDRGQTLELVNCALRDFDTAAIHTIHGFCQLLLHENAFECNQAFDTKLITDESDLFEEIAEDFWRAYFPVASPALASYALHSHLTPAALLGPMRPYIAMAGLSITPELEPKLPRDAERRFEELRSQCIGLWLKNRQEIVAALNPNAVDARKYSPKICVDLFNNFEAFAASSSAGPQLFKAFEKFTQSCISAAIKKNMPHVHHDFFENCEKLLTAANTLKTAYDAYFQALQSSFLSYASAEMIERKNRRNVVYFDDLLLRVSNALGHGSPNALAQAVRARFQAALIDEFQDTDPLQYAIFNTLFPKGAVLFLIGDPKQAIYSFRGADIFAYLTASSNVERRFTLSVNYRSHPRLIQAYNTLFGARPDAFVYGPIRYPPVSPRPDYPLSPNSNARLTLWLLKRNNQDSTTRPLPAADARLRIAQAVAAEVASILSGATHLSSSDGSSPVEPSHIAVLTRTNREATIIRDAFIAQGIPAILESAGTVYEQPEARTLYHLLVALREPARIDHCMAALTTPFFGLTATAIADAFTAETGGGHWMQSLHEYHDVWRESGFMRMMQTLMAREAVRERLLTRPQGSRALTNILHLSELIHAEESRRRLTPGLVCSWLAGKLDSEGASAADEELLRLETDDNAVRIMTIHKSKGLEFPIVFCPFSWSGSDFSRNESKRPMFFHDAHRGFVPTLALSDEKKENNKPMAVEERLAENIRLLYVALTRAQLACYCVWGAISSSETSSLAFLLHGGKPERQTIGELAQYCKGMSDAALAEDLNRIVNVGNGSISIVSMPQAHDVGMRYTHPKTPQLELQSFNATVPQPWIISSFSLLTRAAVDQSADETTANPGLAVSLSADSRAGFESAPSDLHAFPQGPHAGLFFHDILETIDFAQTQTSRVTEDIDVRLKQYGFDEIWRGPVERMLSNLAQTPLTGEPGGPTLAGIAPSSCMREVEFHFPLKHIEPVNVAPLMQACEHGRPDSIDNKKRLQFHPHHGYMKGYIDCIAEHDGRYYLIDWKSNYIGPSFDSYHPQALETTMERHDYTLQYLIYLSALHGLLGLRMKNYNYEKHIGGIVYVFLRGISDNNAIGSGIFFRKPPESVVLRVRETFLRR